MSAQLEPHETGTVPAQYTESRWGMRLRKHALTTLDPGHEATATLTTTSHIEPIEMRAQPNALARIRRGVAIPATAAAVVFMVTIVVSVATVWLQPHAVNAANNPAVELTDAPSSEVATNGTSSPHPSTSGGAGLAEGTLFVHVVGEVHQPGVYELEANSRVLAAIEAAGGATELAILSAVNLARPLADGEQLLVPDAAAAEAPAGGGNQQLLGTQQTPSTNGTVGGAAALTNINTADQATLEALPRVGPALATRILAWRDAQGGFESVDQLLNVSGIGQKTFEQLRELVTV